MDRPSPQQRSSARASDVTARAAASLRGAARLVLAGWMDDSPPRSAGSAAEASFHAAPRRARGTVLGLASTRQAASAATLAAVLAVTPAGAQGQGRPLMSAGADRISFVGWLITASTTMGDRTSVPAAQRAPASVPRWEGRETSLRAPTVRTRLLPRGVVPEPQHEILRYRAQPGEALWVIADKFDISPMTVWWANRLVDKDTLKVGELVRILPTTGIEHLVRDGDTLDSIARAYRADAGAIAEYNSLERAW